MKEKPTYIQPVIKKDKTFYNLVKQSGIPISHIAEAIGFGRVQLCYWLHQTSPRDQIIIDLAAFMRGRAKALMGLADQIEATAEKAKIN
jgi:hypothetical protein